MVAISMSRGCPDPLAGSPDVAQVMKMRVFSGKSLVSGVRANERLTPSVGSVALDSSPIFSRSSPNESGDSWRSKRDMVLKRHGLEPEELF
jgi:hypothetical protein